LGCYMVKDIFGTQHEIDRRQVLAKAWRDGLAKGVLSPPSER